MKVKLPVDRVKEIINEEITLFMDRENLELINENVEQGDQFESWLIDAIKHNLDMQDTYGDTAARWLKQALAKYRGQQGTPDIESYEVEKGYRHNF